jgi:hypothetical protein
MFITNSDRLIARRLAHRRRRTVGETAAFIANCRGYPLSNRELYQLARKMVRHAARNRDKDREDCDDWDEDEDRCLDDDDDEDGTDNQSDKPAKMPKARLAKDYIPPVTSQKRRKRDDDDDDDDDDDEFEENLADLWSAKMPAEPKPDKPPKPEKVETVTKNRRRHLPLPVMNFTFERRLQQLTDRGMNVMDAALVAAADFHSFDSGPSRMMSGGMHSMDTQYALEAPPPASFPRDSEHGRDGRSVAKLTPVPDGLKDADLEDDHSVESMMKFAARTGDLPLPNTVQRLVAEAGNRRAQEEKQARETH